MCFRPALGSRVAAERSRGNAKAKNMHTKNTKRLTEQQAKALRSYRFAAQQEERYLGSVFVNPIRQREVEAKTTAAFDECKALGLTWENGL